VTCSAHCLPPVLGLRDILGRLQGDRAQLANGIAGRVLIELGVKSLCHIENEARLASRVQPLGGAVGQVNVHRQTTSRRSGGRATVDDADGLFHRAVPLRALVGEAGEADELFDDRATDRLVEEAFAADVQLGEKLVVLVGLLGESTHKVGAEDVGWQTLAVGVAEVVGDDLGVFVRQLDDASLALCPLFFQSCFEELGSARDEVTVGEDRVLSRTNVERDGVIFIEAAVDVGSRRLGGELLGGHVVVCRGCV
jgi:hypothetical protein